VEPTSLLALPSAHRLRLATIPTSLLIPTRLFAPLPTRALSEAAEDESCGNRTRHSVKSVRDDAGTQAANHRIFPTDSHWQTTLFDHLRRTTMLQPKAQAPVDLQKCHAREKGILQKRLSSQSRVPTMKTPTPNNSFHEPAPVQTAVQYAIPASSITLPRQQTTQHYIGTRHMLSHIRRERRGLSFYFLHLIASTELHTPATTLIFDKGKYDGRSPRMRFCVVS
jgi:hypothetical protein